MPTLRADNMLSVVLVDLREMVGTRGDARVFLRDAVKVETEEAVGVKPYADEALAIAKRAPVAVVNFMVYIWCGIVAMFCGYGTEILLYSLVRTYDFLRYCR